MTGIVGSGVLCGTIPLLFEVCCELAYPVSEAIASGMQILMFNLVGIIFLSTFFVPNIGRWYTSFYFWAAGEIFSALFPVQELGSGLELGLGLGLGTSRTGARVNEYLGPEQAWKNFFWPPDQRGGRGGRFTPPFWRGQILPVPISLPPLKIPWMPPLSLLCSPCTIFPTHIRIGSFHAFLTLV